MDFDCVIDYHPGKANVVVDALSHKNKSIMETIKENDKRELIKLKKIDAKIELGPEGSLLAQLKVWSILWDRVLEVQRKDTKVNKVRDKVKLGVETPFRVLDDGMVVMDRRMYLPNNKALK